MNTKSKAFLILLTLPVFLLSTPAYAASPTVSFTTTASLELVPDKDVIGVTLTGSGSSAAEAKSAYVTVESAFNALVKESAILKKNVATNSVYSYNSIDTNNVSTFYLTKSASVTFLDVAKGSLFLDQLTNINGVTINSNQLSISNPEAFEDKLVAKATASAKKKALTYAKGLGYKRVVLVKLTQNDSSYPGPIMYASAEKSSDINIDPGTTKQSIAVSSTWRLYN